MILEPEPNAIRIVTDVDVDIFIAEGNVPTTYDELAAFAAYSNPFFIANDATYVTYTLYDSGGKEECALEYEFSISE
jgi:hypothetical protein